MESRIFSREVLYNECDLQEENKRYFENLQQSNNKY